MASIKSFPNNQDEYIGAEYVMKWLHGRTSGVFAAEGNASVSALADSTMAVTVSDGLGWMANAGKDGVVWWIDNEAVKGSKLRLAIDPADGVLNRIDRIIVEWKTTNYVDYPEVKVLKGRLSSKATAPALTNDSTVRQISLAKINVAAGTTAITASMVTDERLNSSVCGLVTEAFAIDTTMVNAQFSELLERIEGNLEQILADQLPDGSISAEKLADDAVSVTYTATVATGWSGSAAPYSKSVKITGLTANDKPIVDLVASSTFATAESQIEAWGYVYRAVTSANTLTLYATDKPTVSLPIQVKVVR